MDMNNRMMLPSVVRVVGVVLVASLVVRGETQMTQLPKFQIEIHAAGEKGPSFTITNLTGKTITACVVELSTSTDPEQKQKTLWDALVLGQPPIEPGANLTQYLGHAVGDPLPNKVEVIAGGLGGWRNVRAGGVGPTDPEESREAGRGLRAGDCCTATRAGTELDWRTVFGGVREQTKLRAGVRDPPDSTS
jgi:hypothetical protein